MRVNDRIQAWSSVLGLMMASGCIIIGDSGEDDGAADTGAVEDSGDGSVAPDDDGSVADDDGSGDDGAGMPPAEVPANEYCADVATWTDDESAFEDEVVALVNMERAAGASCSGQPQAVAGPLTMNPALRCAARVHSLDMAVRMFFDHDNPDGEDPFERMQRAGYQFSAAGENIAAGQTTPAEVVASWMGSPGHCRNIMNADYTEIGVGYVRTDQGEFPHYWTQTFGRPG